MGYWKPDNGFNWLFGMVCELISEFPYTDVQNFRGTLPPKMLVYKSQKSFPNENWCM